MNKIELNDFYSAAYLIALGYEMINIYKIGSQSTFVFKGLEDAREHLGKYYAMTAEVNAAVYSQEIKKLKTIIHNTHSNSGTNTNGRKEKVFDISQG